MKLNVKKALYSHKEKSCTHMIRVGNYPYLPMFVQIRWGYHYQRKNKFHSDENMPGKHCSKRFWVLYILNSLLGMCSFPLHICAAVQTLSWLLVQKGRRTWLFFAKYTFLKTQVLYVWEQVVKWNESLKNAFIKNWN